MATAPRFEHKLKYDGISQKEWTGLPVTFGCSTMARLTGTNKRWCIDHAAELGGVKIAGRWLFSKANAARLLGIE